MKVLLGNPAPLHLPAGETQPVPLELDAPTVTYVSIPDTYTFVPTTLDELARDFIRAQAHPLGLQLPDQEAFVAVVHASGLWRHHHGGQGPSWAASDIPGLQSLLGEFYECPQGVPDDLEATHYTHNGPPGVWPDGLGQATMLKVNAGNDQQSRQMGGGLVGYTGTATATGATSLTGGTETGPTHASNDVVGQTIITSNGTYGVITANTSGTSPVYTVDRWYTPASPGGAAASTPGATTTYTVLPGALPGWYMALTADSAAAAAGDTTLPSEITTASGGLIRKICPYAHTAAAASYTLTPVFTANGSDSLPVTIAKIGVFNSITSGQLLFETKLGTSAVLSLSGDQLTITETVSL